MPFCRIESRTRRGPTEAREPGLVVTVMKPKATLDSTNSRVVLARGLVLPNVIQSCRPPVIHGLCRPFESWRSCPHRFHNFYWTFLRKPLTTFTPPHCTTCNTMTP